MPSKFWTVLGMVYIAFNFWASFMATLEDVSYPIYFPLLVLLFVGIPFALGRLSGRERMR